jgi:hypothetical protein
MIVPHSAADEKRPIAWLGGTPVPELAWARTAVARFAPCIDLPWGRVPADRVAGDASPATVQTAPVVMFLATDRPGRFTLTDATALARRWPLTVLVSVATSLADGRRRSGPPLPGIEELPWCDVPVRLRWWLAALDAGRPGMLGIPATTRREDRLFVAAAQIRGRRDSAGIRRTVAIAAQRPADLDGIAALVASAGHRIVACPGRRPGLDVDADLVLWDVESLDAAQAGWLRLLGAHRPGLPVVLLDSFPNYESAAGALAAGAVAVLARPLSLESLEGALLAGRIGAGFGVGGSAGGG